MSLRSLGLAALSGAAITALAAAPALAGTPNGEVLAAGSDTAVTGSYIVVLKDGTTASPAGIAGKFGGEVDRVYDRALRGLAGRFSASEARRLAADPAVAYVEQNQRVQLAATQANPPSWGLDRIDQRNLPLNSSYTYPASSGVRIYVVDTGVRISHQDFGGRASNGYDAVDGDNVAQDGNGHGTFVAAVAAGTSYGVAKSASIVGVRVLDNNGSGTTAGVIAGVNWVTNNAVEPAVANLSLGGGASTSLDTAVRNSIASGVTYVVAAGNSGANAGNYSPARVTQALTVGATSSTDARASWSNYGSVLDLFAPGVSITSAWATGDTATYTGSGTSFSSPHVAGAAALYLSANPAASPATVHSAIVNTATPNVVSNPGTGSPNRLLFVG
jgi:subtilisin family serine protease